MEKTLKRFCTKWQKKLKFKSSLTLIDGDQNERWWFIEDSQ